MAIVVVGAAVLGLPGVVPLAKAAPLLPGLVGGALLFPLALTVISSADGTPPFFGRLGRAYRSPRLFARGALVGLGIALAFACHLPAGTGIARFVAGLLLGAAPTRASTSRPTPPASRAARAAPWRTGRATRSARCWAASWRAPSAGTSRPTRSRWWRPSSGPTPTSATRPRAGPCSPSASIRCSTSSARSTSGRAATACGCSSTNRCPASSTGASRRRCSRSTSSCWRRCSTARCRR